MVPVCVLYFCIFYFHNGPIPAHLSWSPASCLFLSDAQLITRFGQIQEITRSRNFFIACGNETKPVQNPEICFPKKEANHVQRSRECLSRPKQCKLALTTALVKRIWSNWVPSWNLKWFKLFQDGEQCTLCLVSYLCNEITNSSIPISKEYSEGSYEVTYITFLTHTV